MLGRTFTDYHDHNNKTTFSNVISANDSLNGFDEDLSEIGANSSISKAKKGKKKKKKKANV